MTRQGGRYREPENRTQQPCCQWSDCGSRWRPVLCSYEQVQRWVIVSAEPGIQHLALLVGRQRQDGADLVLKHLRRRDLHAEERRRSEIARNPVTVRYRGRGALRRGSPG